MAAEWIKYKINNVQLYPPACTQMNDTQARTYNAFCDLKEQTGKFPSTAQITRYLGKSNQTNTRKLLMQLVRKGYLGAYMEASKWCWCNRAEAVRLNGILSKSDVKSAAQSD